MKTTTTEISTGKLVHEVYDDGYEVWRTYDTNNNCINSRNSNGYEVWYDGDNNEIPKLQFLFGAFVKSILSIFGR